MKLLILDGHSIANRAYYGVRILNTADGTPTNAIFGFLNIYLKLMAEEQPDAVCVAFDEHAPTFRKEKYEAYKAQRKEADEAFVVQLPILREVLAAMNVPCYSMAGYEADDLIGTAARICEEAGWECVISTGDKDSFQLISTTTKVKHVRTRMGVQEAKDYTLDAFREEYGFDPERMVDLKALMGDTSDNIPGVPGVGEKTAMTLLHKYGTAEKIYEDLGALDERDSLKKKLAAGKESMELSYWLATICRTAPFDFKPEENICKKPENDALYRLFTTLEFTKMIQRFELVPPVDGKTEVQTVQEDRTAVTVTDGDAVLAQLKSAPWCAFAADEEFFSFCVSLGTEDFCFDRENTREYDAALRAVLGGEVKKAGHHVKEIMVQCLGMGIETDGWVFDTALAAYLLDPTASEYPLNRLEETWCGISHREEEAPEDGQMTFDQLGNGDTLSGKSAAVWHLRPVLEEAIKNRGQEELLFNLEMPLCRVLAEMETAGVLVDTDALREYGLGLQAAAEATQKDIFALVGHEFNINSPKQLGQVLFEERMLPAPKKTKTGYSTGAEVLEKLRGKDPVIQMIMDYRELTKLKSTYADGLLREVRADGRIHTKFQMTVTATGRLSSAEPNLQNIPVRRELGGEFRRMFTAAPGNVLVDADYSQIELRLLAHISGDAGMRNAFLSGEDVHAATASQVFDVPLEEVSSVQRSRAKAVNFGIVYGISAFSLSQNIGVTPGEAKAYMERYLEHFSGVQAYQKDIVKQAARDGYVETLYRRRRALPELQSPNFNLRAFGERVALNMPIQGTAADIMKLAMLRVRDRLKRDGLAGRLVLQIHDELIVECPEAEAEKVSALLREEMEGAASLSVPLTAETGIGKTWYEAK